MAVAVAAVMAQVDLIERYSEWDKRDKELNFGLVNLNDMMKLRLMVWRFVEGRDSIGSVQAAIDLVVVLGLIGSGSVSIFFFLLIA